MLLHEQYPFYGNLIMRSPLIATSDFFLKTLHHACCAPHFLSLFMSPRNRSAVPPKDEPPAPTGTGNPDRARRAPAWRSRTRVQARAVTLQLQDEEQFDLDAISGSDGEYEPPPSDHGRGANAIEECNSRNHVNDPDTAPLPRTTANDIHHFFDKSGDDKVVCIICRQVCLHSPLFSLLN